MLSGKQKRQDMKEKVEVILSHPEMKEENLAELVDDSTYLVNLVREASKNGYWKESDTDFDRDKKGFTPSQRKYLKEHKPWNSYMEAFRELKKKCDLDMSSSTFMRRMKSL